MFGPEQGPPGVEEETDGGGAGATASVRPAGETTRAGRELSCVPAAGSSGRTVDLRAAAEDRVAGLAPGWGKRLAAQTWAEFIQGSVRTEQGSKDRVRASSRSWLGGRQGSEPRDGEDSHRGARLMPPLPSVAIGWEGGGPSWSPAACTSSMGRASDATAGATGEGGREGSSASAWGAGPRGAGPGSGRSWGRASLGSLETSGP